MVDMAVAHPGVERFPTVGDLEEADNAAGVAVSVPTFSEMDAADQGPQGYEPPPTAAGRNAQVAAAATLSVSSSRLAASSLDTDNLANTVDAIDEDENPKPYPTLDYSSLTQSQGEDLDTTMDASKPAAATTAAAPEHVIKDLDTTLDAMKPAPAAAALPAARVVKDLDTTVEVPQPSEAAAPSEALAKDDLDATVHIPRIKASSTEGNDELDATVELKLPVPSRDHSPTIAAPKDASPPPTDARRGYEALKQGLGQGSSEGPTRQSQRSGASGSSQWGNSQASSSKAIPRSDPFLQRPPRPDKAQGPPQGPPQHGEPLQFCSNRSKDKDSEPGPLTSILQSFFICFSRQSG